MSAQPPAQLANLVVAQQAPVLPLTPVQPIFALGPCQDNTTLDYSNILIENAQRGHFQGSLLLL